MVGFARDKRLDLPHCTDKRSAAGLGDDHAALPVPRPDSSAYRRAAAQMLARHGFRRRSRCPVKRRTPPQQRRPASRISAAQAEAEKRAKC
jgi:hypothetical protein